MSLSTRTTGIHLPITILCAGGLAVFTIVPLNATAKSKSSPVSARHEPARSKPIVVKAEAATKPEIPNPPDTPKPDIDGMVLDPGGKPVAGARVIWGTLPNDDEPPMVVKTDSEGRFHFDGKIAWSRKAYNDQLVAQADGFGVAGARLPFGGDDKHATYVNIALALPTVAHFKVLNQQGAPMAGIAIHVTGIYKDRIGLLIPANVGVPKAVSASDGSVTFPGLPQGWMATLSVDDPRFAQLQYPELQPTLDDTAATEWPAIKLIPAASIEGVLTTPDGKPVAGVSVTARPAERLWRQTETTTDDKGHFLLKQMRAGQYSIEENITAPLNTSLTTQNMPYTLAEGAHKTGLKLSLVKGAIVTGHVVYRDTNKPASEVSINLNHMAGGSTDSSAYTSTDESGNYRLCIAGGSLNISLSTSITPDVTQEFTAAAGETKTMDFTVNHPVETASIDGIVVGQDGKPVAGAVVTGSTLDHITPPSTPTGPDGKFSISSAASPIIYLRARKGDSVTLKDTPALNGDNVTLKLQDNVLASINGKVVDSAGQPIAGIKVNAEQQREQDSDVVNTVQTDASGAYHIASLWPGFRYSLEVSDKGFGLASVDQLFPKPGETLTADNIVLKRTNSFVAGHVVDSHGTPLANASVILGSDRDKRTTTDKQGHFRIDGVAPGNAVVEVSAGDEFTYWEATAGKDNNLVKTYSQSAMNARIASEPKGTDYTGKYAPEFNVATWVNVSPVSMSDLKGKIVIFDMWACCTDNLLATQQIAQQFASRGVVAIGLNVTGSKQEDIQQHIAKENLTLPIAIDKDTAKGLGGTGNECYSLVGRDGKVAYAGFDFNQVMAAMGKLLAQK